MNKASSWPQNKRVDNSVGQKVGKKVGKKVENKASWLARSR
jgi:hypothetical protein